MLVLARKKHEQVVIDGGEIVVEVLAITEHGVRLGFSATKDHSIHRAEVQEAIDGERANGKRN